MVGVLLWNRRSRALLAVLFGVLFAVVVLAPLAMIALAAVAGSWNGVLPTGWTPRHLAAAVTGDTAASAWVSVQTALIASAGAVLLGTWAALALPAAPPGVRRVVDTALHLPVAVPSVVVGLGLLVAHLVLVLPFTCGVVSAAQRRVDPQLAAVAASLGARPARVLWQVRLPALLPAVSASASLALALSMGEVGATAMVYPPDWRTLPISVFAQADRGQVFAASASTVLLLAVTLAGLLALARLTRRR